MGPLSNIWEEVDDLDKDQSNMKIFELKEQIKNHTDDRQTKLACLFKRRLNFRAKLMHSGKMRTHFQKQRKMPRCRSERVWNGVLHNPR